MKHIRVPDEMPDDVIADIEAHMRSKMPGPDTYDPPVHGWTCFHCGETFRTAWGARVHFGDGAKQVPALCLTAPSEKLARLA